jgi:hypothetical protein
MFFIFGCVFAAAFIALIATSLIWHHLLAIAATIVAALGTAVFFFESDAKKRWAAGFNDRSKCPNCGEPYVVWWWSRNDREHW